MKRTLLITFALLAAICLVGFTLSTARPAAQQWEYKTIAIKTYMFVSSGSPDIDKLLNSMGEG